jgi:hypothetical protein
VIFHFRLEEVQKVAIMLRFSEAGLKSVRITQLSDNAGFAPTSRALVRGVVVVRLLQGIGRRAEREYGQQMMDDVVLGSQSWMAEESAYMKSALVRKYVMFVMVLL